jgi:hypothetical protein
MTYRETDKPSLMLGILSSLFSDNAKDIGSDFEHALKPADNEGGAEKKNSKRGSK